MKSATLTKPWRIFLFVKCTVMYDGWKATDWTCLLYFISLVVFGNFIVLQLFVAILLGNFESDEQEILSELGSVEGLHRKRPEPPLNLSLKESEAILSPVAIKSAKNSVMPAGFEKGEAESKVSLTMEGKVTKTGSKVSLCSEGREEAGVGDAFIVDGLGGGGDEEVVALRERNKTVLHKENIGLRKRGTSKMLEVEEKKSEAQIFDSLNEAEEHILFGKSLCLFSADNTFRQGCHRVITAKMFDNVILVLILFSTIFLAVDSPLLDESSPLASILKVSLLFGQVIV